MKKLMLATVLGLSLGTLPTGRPAHAADLPPPASW